MYQYIWVSSQWTDPTSTKVCLQTTMNFSAAVSPAFVIDGLYQNVVFIKKSVLFPYYVNCTYLVVMLLYLLCRL